MNPAIACTRDILAGCGRELGGSVAIPLTPELLWLGLSLFTLVICIVGWIVERYAR